MRRIHLPRGRSEAFALLAVIVGVVYAFAIVRAVDHVTVFSGDDVTTSWQGRTLPFDKLLFTPIDVHTVPLHRLFTYALSQLAPLNDRAALGVMLTLHAASVWLLYRALAAIAPAVTHAFVVACYATYVHLGPLFSWWVAAVHRFPLMCCMGGAVWAYAHFRRRPSLGLGGLVAGMVLVGLGFFEKAVFIPPVLLGVEASLHFTDPSAPSMRRKLALLHGVLLAIAAAFLVIWRHTVDPQMMGDVVTDLSYLAEYSRLSWLVFVSAVVGRIDDGMWLGIGVLVALVGVACALQRVNVVPFVVAGVLVCASLVVTALSSSRMSMWGLFWTRCWRYYPDVMYVFVLFAGLALGRASSAPALRRLAGPAYATAATLGAAVLLVLLARTSYVDGARAVLGDVNVVRSRVYLDNVRAGIRRLEAEHARPLFVDGVVPDYLQLFRDDRARHRTLLSALGVPFRMTRARDGAYRIDGEGNVVPLKHR